MKHGAVVLVLLVFLTSGCGHSKRTGPRSTAEVVAALRDAHLVPHRVTIELTSTAAAGTPVVFTDALAQSSASDSLAPLATLDADQHHAVVYIFPTTSAASALSGLYPNSMRAKNVVAVPVGGRLSPRMRGVVFRLR